MIGTPTRLQSVSRYASPFINEQSSPSATSGQPARRFAAPLESEDFIQSFGAFVSITRQRFLLWSYALVQKDCHPDGVPRALSHALLRPRSTAPASPAP